MRHQTALAVVALIFSPFHAVLGQSTTVTLVGTVVDSTTRMPLAGVSIHLDGRRFADSSDQGGDFLLADLAHGEHSSLMMKDGYTPKAFRFAVPEAAQGEIDLGVVELAEGPPPTAVLSGTVVDAHTRQPIAGANVVLNGTLVGSTNVVGMIRSSERQVMWGVNPLEFQRLGYSPLHTELWIEQAESSLNLDVVLEPAAFPLEEVVVEGARDTRSTEGLNPAFVRRFHLGGGEFFIEKDIEEIKPRMATDILRRASGIEVRPDGTGGFVPRNKRKRFCRPPLLFVDGVRYPNIDDLNWVVPPEIIRAVEVYASAAQVPPELSMQGSDCGVIVVWTR